MQSSVDINPEIVLIIGTIGMLLLAISIVIFIFLYQRKLIRRKLAYQEIEDLLKKQELRSAYAILEGQEMERKRIAGELHDNLGSILVTLNMYTDTALSTDNLEKKDKIIQKLGEVASKASEETRKLSHQLDSASLKHFGLKTALKDLVQAVKDNKAINIIHNVQLSHEVDNDSALNLYRILQELVTNTLKHAKASTIRIDVTEVNSEYISIIYEDNGIGYNKDLHNTGIGMKNIKSRVEQLSGDINIESKPKGFCIIIEIPML